MKRIVYLFYTLLLCMSVVFLSCKNCKNPDCKCEKGTCTDSCQCGEPNKEDSIEELKVTNAYLYFDNSASMKGYAGDIHNFTDVLTDLVNVYPSTEVLLCSDDYAPIDKSKGDLIDQVRKVSYGKSSLLTKDIESMIWKVKSGCSIAFLVTDGILSGTDKDISNDRDWTLRHVAQLQHDVEKAFRDNPEIAVSVYQFIANFNGRYICYNNSNQANVNITRYYYVFVVGEKFAVMDFKEKKDKFAHFKPVNQLHFIAQHPVTGGVNVKNAKKNGSGIWEYTPQTLKNNDNILNVTIKDKDFKDEFSMSEIAELAERIKVTPEKGVMVDEIVYDEKNQNYLIPIKMFSPKHEVEIAMDYKMPAWVAASSCDNDLYMTTNKKDKKTFLLLNLITGIQRGKMAGTDNLYYTTVKFERVEK